jgi:hypothetical protein
MYGMMLGSIELRYVKGFVYICPVPLGLTAADTGKAPPPWPIMWALFRLHPGIRARLAIAGRLFIDKPWIKDSERFYKEQKPLVIQRNLELQGVDLKSLTDIELAEHLAKCVKNLEFGYVYSSFQFNLNLLFVLSIC